MAPAPTNPPSGAHQGIAATPAGGKGRGIHKKTQAKSATKGKKDTKLANQGLVIDFCNAPFIVGPHACNIPAIMITG